MPEATTPVNITYTPCDSSQIAEHGYDAATSTLGLKFRSSGAVGAAYHYFQVPPALYSELLASPSIGKFFGASVRGKFDFQKQPDQPGGVAFGLLLKQEPKYTTATATGRLTSRATGKPIPDDEPVFVLRAQDAHAVAALAFYRGLCSQPDHQAVIKSRIADFERFAAANPSRMKEPDSNLHELATASLTGTPATPRAAPAAPALSAASSPF